jgi:LysR family pca operon transcriptional activator
MTENGIGPLPQRIETVSGAFGRIYLQNSDAVWIISDSVVANEIERGILARLPFETDTMLGPIGVMEREDWDRSAPAWMFRRTLQEVIQADRSFRS